MESELFDHAIRMLGAGATRRAGLRAAVAALLGASAAGEAVAGNEHGRATEKRAGGEGGPCGDGSAKANRCAKPNDCCTGICARNHRCRCRKKNRKCKQDRNCCGALSCVKKKCAPPPKPPAPVPTGGSCGPTDTCANDDATCTTYEGGSPAGTYCLLDTGGACTAETQCASGRCDGGACGTCSCGACAGACVPTVCATCAHTTVQAAIDAAAAGDVIAIAPGTYDEDLTVTQSVTLRGCPGGEVILKNATLGSRTLLATGTDLVLIDVVIEGYDQRPSSGGGGVASTGNVTLCGNAAVRNIFQTSAALSMAGGLLTLLAMNDQSAVHGCESTGVVLGDFASLTMNDRSAIRDNIGTAGAGVFMIAASGAGAIEMNDASSISGNQATGSGGGGGIYAFSTGYGPVLLTMNDDATITGNTSVGPGGGAVVTFGPHDGNGAVRLAGRAAISGNHSDSYGGGGLFAGVPVNLADESVIADNTAPWAAGLGMSLVTTPFAGFTGLTLSGDAAISGNTASTGVGGGVWVGGASITMAGSSTVTGNSTPTAGGGIYLAGAGGVDARLDITESATVTGNTAGTQGGGVGAATVGNVVTGAAAITGNTPDNCLGATGC